MIDWLSVTVDIDKYDINISSIKKELEETKIASQELASENSAEKALIELFGQSFMMYPNGSASYAYIMHNDLLELRLAKGRSSNIETYPIYVHFKSEFLWNEGPEQCWKWFKKWITNNLGDVIANKVNRVDLCCHTDENIELDLNKYKGKYSECSLHHTNRKNTGISFGSRKGGTIVARIYNKTKEIKKSRKLWFNGIWEKENMNTENVINIEFELKRKCIRSLKVNDEVIDSCEALFKNLCSIWFYCTSDWLVLLKGNYKRADRAQMHPTWETIQSAFASYKGEGLVHRKTQKKCKKEVLIPSLLGYLSSYAALSGIKDLNTATELFAKEGTWNYKIRGKNFNEIVDNKIKLIDAQRGGEKFENKL